MPNLVSKEDVKEALNIKTFREMSGEKIVEFISLLPNMDKEVALSIVKQYPEFNKYSSYIVSQIKELSSEALKTNDNSQSEVLASYNKTLEVLESYSKKDGLSHSEVMETVEKMIVVNDKMNEKDTENKDFLREVLKDNRILYFGIAALGLTLLGVNAKGIKLPKLKS